MFCIKCGAQNPDDAAFCAGCGCKIQPDPNPTAVTASSPVSTTDAYAPTRYAPTAHVPTGYAPSVFAPAPAPAMPAPAATNKGSLAKILVPISIVAVVAIVAVVVILFVFPGILGSSKADVASAPAPEPSKVSYTITSNGQSVGPVEFTKQGDDLVVTVKDGSVTSSVTLTKEGTMDGGTIYSLPAGQSNSSLGISSSYSYKYLIPDGFFRGDLKGKWIMWQQYGSSGYAVALDVQDGGTGIEYSISTDAFPTSFSQMQSAKSADNFTWTEQGGKWTILQNGSILIVEKVG